MGSCVKCHSERVRTIHKDRLIITRCKTCGHVEREVYGPHRKPEKSEAEQGAQEVVG